MKLGSLEHRGSFIASKELSLLYNTVLLRLRPSTKALRERSTPLFLYFSSPTAIPAPFLRLDLVRPPPLDLCLPSKH